MWPSVTVCARERHVCTLAVGMGPSLVYLRILCLMHMCVQVRVPKGNILALCPFISHHDDSLYPPSAAAFQVRPF